jgi:iron complex outermembrane receptor protein
VSRRSPAVAFVLGAILAADAAWAADATASADAVAADEADAIVVTARNRSEDVQDVPIPISVLSGERIARERVFTIADLTQRAPGLTATSPNARRTGVSIRGIGKTSGNDNAEPAVGVIVDDVFLGQVGMSYQDFTDLAQVEVLRGPQGTLLGKNTTLGVIKYSSKKPSFTPEATLELEAGINRGSGKARGSFSDALAPDLLAFRASFFVDQQKGDILNVAPQGGHWHERDRWGGRVQLLLAPADNLAVKLNADLARTDENSNTKPFMVDPATLNDGSARNLTYSTRLARNYFGGYRPIIGSWDEIELDMAAPLKTNNGGVSLVADWDTGPVNITSISAVRWFSFDAKNDSEQTRFAIARSGTLVDTRQLSQEFRFSGKITPRLEYQAGLYLFAIDTRSTGRNVYGADAGAFFATDAQYRTLDTVAGRALLRAALDGAYQGTFQKPQSDSEAVFGQLNWRATDRLTLTAGLRYTKEQKTNVQSRTSRLDSGGALASTGNATADAIRLAQLGIDYGLVEGMRISHDSVAWLINPAFHVTGDLLIYASASRGEKSGAVAFDSNGTRRNVLPEKATDYELGYKATLLDRQLTLSANLYLTKVRDYQNTTSEPDPASSTGYSSRLGNIPGIKARGFEAEASLDLRSGFSLTLGGAYNKATYTDWRTATCPRSFPASVPICDNTGRQIVGAPKWTVTASVNYETDLPGLAAKLHLFGNNVYRSRHNLEQLLSPYGVQKGYHLTDVGIGLIRPFGDVRTELSLVAKNVFDVKYTTSVNDFSNTAPVGYDGIGARRYVGALLRGSF